MTAAFSPPFPTNPNVGDTFCGWTWNGSMWVCTSAHSSKSRPSSRAALTCRPPACSAASRSAGAAAAAAARRKRSARPTWLAAAAAARAATPNRVCGGDGQGRRLGDSRRGRHQHRDAANGGATSFGAICVANGGYAGAGANGVNVYGWAVRGPRRGSATSPRPAWRASPATFRLAQARRISRPQSAAGWLWAARRSPVSAASAASSPVRTRPRTPEPRLGGGGQPAGERVWNDALRRQWRLGPVRRDGVYLRRPRRELEPVRVRRAGPRGARWLAWTWTGRFR